MTRLPLGVQSSRHDRGLDTDSSGSASERGVTPNMTESSSSRMGVTRSAEQRPYSPTRARRARRMSDEELRVLTGLSDRAEAERAYAERRLDPHRPRRRARVVIL